MRTHIRNDWAFVVVLTLMIAAFWVVGDAETFAKSKVDSTAIHGKHLSSDIGLECAVCHADVAKDKGIMQVFPSSSSCKDCHDDPAQVGFEQRKSEKRGVAFAHKDHLELGKTCADCHLKDPKATQLTMPTHEQCKECHASDYEQMLCAKCHISFGELGLTKLASYKHANDFKSRHAEFARREARSCAQCHTESYCLDCHNKHEDLKPSLKYPEKVRTNMIHRGDWMTAHRIEAKVNSASCLKCHGVKYCTDCHNLKGVGAKAEKGFFQHPTGWMSKGSSDFHGTKARTEIVSCASCHDRGGAGDCRTCHRGSLGLNPHPEGWDGNGMSKKERVCAECHSH